jgi:hypothetical protein
MRGRKPKPTTLRILEGNPGKRSLKDEPSESGSSSCNVFRPSARIQHQAPAASALADPPRRGRGDGAEDRWLFGGIRGRIPLWRNDAELAAAAVVSLLWRWQMETISKQEFSAMNCGKRTALRRVRGKIPVGKQRICPEHVIRRIDPVWLFGPVPNGFWTEPAHRRQFLLWLAGRLRFRYMEDWYRLMWRDITKNGGGGADYYWRSSPSRAVKECFPNTSGTNGSSRRRRTDSGGAPKTAAATSSGWPRGRDVAEWKTGRA